MSKFTFLDMQKRIATLEAELECANVLIDVLMEEINVSDDLVDQYEASSEFQLENPRRNPEHDNLAVKDFPGEFNDHTSKPAGYPPLNQLPAEPTEPTDWMFATDAKRNGLMPDSPKQAYLHNHVNWRSIDNLSIAQKSTVCRELAHKLGKMVCGSLIKAR